MAPHPRDSQSSGATVAMIAAVVIGVLILGLLAMVAMGFLFFVTVRTAPAPIMEPDAPVIERIPLETLPSPAEPPEVLESPPQPDDMAPAEPAESDLDTSEPVEPAEAPAPAVVPSAGPPPKPLADLTPVEVADVRIGGEPLARSVKIAGRAVPSAIWAQPSADLGACQVSYSIDGAYVRLTGVAAVADAGEGAVAAAPKGSLRIYGDGNLLWDAGTLEGYGASKPFDVDIRGIRHLVLVTESDVASAASPFVWADLRLVPAPPSESP